MSRRRGPRQVETRPVDSFFPRSETTYTTTPPSVSSPFSPHLADPLSSLDLSFNNIRHPPHLPSLGRVAVLYLVQNKIARIEEGELDWCAETITSLELGGNRIRVSRQGAGGFIGIRRNDPDNQVSVGRSTFLLVEEIGDLDGR